MSTAGSVSGSGSGTERDDNAVATARLLRDCTDELEYIELMTELCSSLSRVVEVLERMRLAAAKMAAGAAESPTTKKRRTST